MLTQRPLGILLSFGVVCIFLAILLSFGLRWQQKNSSPPPMDQAPAVAQSDPAPMEDPPSQSVEENTTTEPPSSQEAVVSASALKTAPKPLPATSPPASETKEEKPAETSPPQTETAAKEAPKLVEQAPAPPKKESAPVEPPPLEEIGVPADPLSAEKPTAIPVGPPHPTRLEALLQPLLAGPPAPENKAANEPEVVGLSDKGALGPPFPVPQAFVGVPHPVPSANTTTIVDATSSRSSHHDMEQKKDLDDEAKAVDNSPLPQSSSKSSGSISSSSKAPAFSSWEIRKYEGRDYVTANSIYRFYRFNSYSVEGKSVWFRSPVLIMKSTLGSSDLLINNIKFVMSYPLVNIDGKPSISRLDLCKLIDPILRPSYIGNAGVFDTVIIDPGHGGHDSGAKGVYGYEKDFALKLAYALKPVLERQGLKVHMTRTDDTFISLGGRVAIANKIPNSIYISLHYNSSDGSSATGIETFALSPQGASSIYGARSVDYTSFRGNERDSENIALATAVHAAVIHHFKLVDRGVKRARWHVLTGLRRPGILFEGGFVTNPNDARLIAADNFRREMAATIAQAIMNYRRALQPRATTPRSSAPTRNRRSR